MRIWSIHPKYLDTKGLVALWRETLLAKHVLEGKTRGYKNHPQLIRFKVAVNPLDCISHYLSVVYHEAGERGYCFDKTKLNWNFNPVLLNVSKGQLVYERIHLLNKLKIRDLEKYQELAKITYPEAHPIFQVIEGEIEDWEKNTGPLHTEA